MSDVDGGTGKQNNCKRCKVSIGPPANWHGMYYVGEDGPYCAECAEVVVKERDGKYATT